jgi:hypothetical protein
MVNKRILILLSFAISLSSWGCAQRNKNSIIQKEKSFLDICNSKLQIYSNGKENHDSLLSNKNLHNYISKQSEINLILNTDYCDTVRPTNNINILNLSYKNLKFDDYLPYLRKTEELQLIRNYYDNSFPQYRFLPFNYNDFNDINYLRFTDPYQLPEDLDELAKLDSLQYISIYLDFLAPEMLLKPNLKGIIIENNWYALDYSGIVSVYDRLIKKQNFSDFIDNNHLVFDFNAAFNTRLKDVFSEFKFKLSNFINEKNELVINTVRSNESGFYISILGNVTNNLPDGKWFYIKGDIYTNRSDTILKASFLNGKREGKWVYKRLNKSVTYESGDVIEIKKYYQDTITEFYKNKKPVGKWLIRGDTDSTFIIDFDSSPLYIEYKLANWENDYSSALLEKNIFLSNSAYLMRCTFLTMLKNYSTINLSEYKSLKFHITSNESSDSILITYLNDSICRLEQNVHQKNGTKKVSIECRFNNESDDYNMPLHGKYITELNSSYSLYTYENGIPNGKVFVIQDKDTIMDGYYYKTYFIGVKNQGKLRKTVSQLISDSKIEFKSYNENKVWNEKSVEFGSKGEITTIEIDYHTKQKTIVMIYNKNSSEHYVYDLEGNLISKRIIKNNKIIE